MNSASGGIDQLGDLASPAKGVDNSFERCLGSIHGNSNMRYSQQSQEESCDNRFCISGGYVGNYGMSSDSIFQRLEALGLKQKDLADALDMSADKVSKIASGARQWRGDELQRALHWLCAKEEGFQIEADYPPDEISRAYLPVDILPSYAGMGGGGNGDGEVQTGLVPRTLIENELRAKVSDLLLIEARGDSMEPDFQHGDQILIDKRDRDPVQPGSFALWDGDAYVIKLVERIPQKRGFYRVFSANGRYTAAELSAEEIQIMGRPVWFARRL